MLKLVLVSCRYPVPFPQPRDGGQYEKIQKHPCGVVEIDGQTPSDLSSHISWYVNSLNQILCHNKVHLVCSSSSAKILNLHTCKIN